MKWSFVFAAPFAIVVACKSPPADESHQVARVPPVAALADAPVPIDAGPNAHVSAELVATPQPPSSNPPDPMLARIISLSVAGEKTKVALARGTLPGVTTRWRATFVRDGAVPLPDGECVITHVDDRMIHCLSSLALDLLKPIGQARLSPD